LTVQSKNNYMPSFLYDEQKPNIGVKSCCLVSGAAWIVPKQIIIVLFHSVIKLARPVQCNW